MLGCKLVVKIAANTFDGLLWTDPKVEFMLGQEVQKSISESVSNIHEQWTHSEVIFYSFSQRFWTTIQSINDWRKVSHDLALGGWHQPALHWLVIGWGAWLCIGALDHQYQPTLEPSVVQIQIHKTLQIQIQGHASTNTIRWWLLLWCTDKQLYLEHSYAQHGAQW